MRKRKFALDSVMKYRSYLEKNQAEQFRNALGKEVKIESDLLKQNIVLRDLRDKRDSLISETRLDIKAIKKLQEEILFAELDEETLERNLIDAKRASERERLAWIEKKSEKDAIIKLEEKHIRTCGEETIREEQKDLDEIAGQKFAVRKVNKN